MGRTLAVAGDLAATTLCVSATAVVRRAACFKFHRYSEQMNVIVVRE